MTVIFFSASQGALVAFQLDQVLLRASTSPRSIARLMALPPGYPVTILKRVPRNSFIICG